LIGDFENESEKQKKSMKDLSRDNDQKSSQIKELQDKLKKL
jgi:hypothetical protein